MRATFRRAGPPSPFTFRRYAETLCATIAACYLSHAAGVPDAFLPPLAASLTIAAISLSLTNTPAAHLPQSALAAAAHTLAFRHATHTLRVPTYAPAALLAPILLLLRPPPIPGCYATTHPHTCACAALHAAIASLARALPGAAAAAVVAGSREILAVILAAGAASVVLAVAGGVLSLEQAGMDGAVELGALAAVPAAAALLADEPGTWTLAAVAEFIIVVAISQRMVR